MAHAHASIDISRPANEVWQLMGGFGSLPDWLPYIPKSELKEGGRIRYLWNPDGDPIIERLLSFDDEVRSYSYAILQAPFPVTDYVSTLGVVDKGDGASRVEWSGTFKPAGVTDHEASKLFEKIYEDGLKALEETLEKKK